MKANMNTPIKKSWSQIRQEKINRALAYGIVRPIPVQASNEQSLTFILREAKPFQHATLESASAERYFLQAALGIRVRIMKVWNEGRQSINEDMLLLRGRLTETPHWDASDEALDRVLKGAGY